MEWCQWTHGQSDDSLSMTEALEETVENMFHSKFVICDGNKHNSYFDREK